MLSVSNYDLENISQKKKPKNKKFIMQFFYKIYEICKKDSYICRSLKDKLQLYFINSRRILIYRLLIFISIYKIGRDLII